MRLALWSCIIIFVFGYAKACDAGEGSPGTTALPHNPFSRGATEIELLAGAFFSVDAGNASKPTINLASEGFRFGIMLTEPGESGLLAGNAEFLLEGFAAEVFAGPGTAVGSASFILRYNFLHPHALVVPYCQIGGGGAYNDIAHTQSQSLLGSEFEFTLQGGVGVRVILNERLSLIVEHDLLHLSNAGSTDRNHGLNSLGVLGGVGFSF